MSDSSNLVGIFENEKWNVRAAYNWRDKFLASTFDGAGPNPQYVEAYGQLDLSIGYNINKNLSVQFEGINLTDEANRQNHGELDGVRDSTYVYHHTGRQVLVGARYKF